MLLVQRMTTDGRHLFRLRSVVPLVLVPLVLIAADRLAHFELRWGGQAEDMWLLSCALLSGLGLALRCFTVGFAPPGTSGRGTTIPSAASLNDRGIYSIVRNPLYLANAIMWLGVALATASGWFAAVTMLAYWLYIERVISAEESFLAEQFGDAYDRWIEHTPCFLPRPSLWRPADIGFSLRTVLRREYPGLIVLAVAFPLMDYITDVLIGGEPWRHWLRTDRGWFIFFVGGIAVGLIIRCLKKLHLLDEADR